MTELLVWGLALLGVLVVGRWMLAYLRRFLLPAALVLLLVLVLAQCEGDVRQVLDGFGST